MTGLAQLLVDCDACGIRLLPASDGRLTVEGPEDALSPELMDRLKTNKGELLAMLPVDDGPPPLAQAVKASVSADGKWHTLHDITRGEFDWINEAFDSHPDPIGPVCRCHKEQLWWRSIYGDHLICGVCHPPVSPEVVVVQPVEG